MSQDELTEVCAEVCEAAAPLLLYAASRLTSNGSWAEGAPICQLPWSSFVYLRRQLPKTLLNGRVPRCSGINDRTLRRFISTIANLVLNRSVADLTIGGGVLCDQSGMG